MQLGTRVKLKAPALKKEIEKVLSEGKENALEWVVYLAHLYDLEGSIDGLWPTSDAPPGVLEICWDAKGEWDEYLNGRDEENGSRVYGWYEDELEVV